MKKVNEKQYKLILDIFEEYLKYYDFEKDENVEKSIKLLKSETITDSDMVFLLTTYMDIHDCFMDMTYAELVEFLGEEHAELINLLRREDEDDE